MYILNKKLLSDREKNVIFLTHFMAPAGKIGDIVYNSALHQLGKFGQIILVEDQQGVWNCKYGHFAHSNKLNFQPNARRFTKEYSEPFILKKLHSSIGLLDIEFIQDDIMDKNLFFSGYSLYCCVRNTIFSAAPVAAIKNQSQTFTLLKEYLWAEVIVDNQMYSQVLNVPDEYFQFYNHYLEIPAWPMLKKTLLKYYAFPETLLEREIMSKVYDYYGINLFFHYAGREHPLYDRRQNKLRIDLVLRQTALEYPLITH